MTTSMTTDQARLDVCARGFWVSGQMAFNDVRVFNTLAKRYRDLELSKFYQINEKEKKRQYVERIIEIEHGSFTSLIFSDTSGMGRECMKFYSRLSEMIAEKKKMSKIPNRFMDKKKVELLISMICD